MIVLISVLSFIFDNSLLYIFFQTMFEKEKKDYNPYYILFSFIIADTALKHLLNQVLTLKKS